LFLSLKNKVTEDTMRRNIFLAISLAAALVVCVAPSAASARGHGGGGGSRGGGVHNSGGFHGGFRQGGGIGISRGYYSGYDGYIAPRCRRVLTRYGFRCARYY